jgi:hypothetical protein
LTCKEKSTSLTACANRLMLNCRVAVLCKLRLVIAGELCSCCS